MCRRCYKINDECGSPSGKSSQEGEKRDSILFTSPSKENVCPNREEQEETEHYHPPMDFSNLHGCEPVLSWSHVFTDPHEGVTLSPRSSFFISGGEETSSSWVGGCDHSSPPSPPLSQQDLRRNQREANDKQTPEVRRLTKKLKSVKRQLRDRQHVFEKEFGYRPSHADRITDTKMRELTHHLSRLRKELKHLKEVAAISAMSPAVPVTVNSTQTSEQSDAEMMKETYSHVDKLLQDSRMSDGRGECLEDYSQEQVISEKQALQRALLMWEKQHGRPTERAARSIIRPLYDRHRMLKRMLLKFSSSKCKNGLQPIIEHEETMSWQQSSTQDREDEEEDEQTLSSTESSSVKNYHEMTMEELLSEQKICQEKKNELGRKIKEWEDSFQERSGRKAQKEDRRPMQASYSSYKETKHNLRLLAALIGKKGAKRVNAKRSEWQCA